METPEAPIPFPADVGADPDAQCDELSCAILHLSRPFNSATPHRKAPPTALLPLAASVMAHLLLFSLGWAALSGRPLDSPQAPAAAFFVSGGLHTPSQGPIASPIDPRATPDITPPPALDSPHPSTPTPPLRQPFPLPESANQPIESELNTVLPPPPTPELYTSRAWTPIGASLNQDPSQGPFGAPRINARIKSPLHPNANTNPTNTAATTATTTETTDYHPPSIASASPTPRSRAARRGLRTGLSPSGFLIPEYPAAARRKRQEGLVQLQVEIRADGNIGQINVLSDPGYPLLVESAIDAVRRARFNPAQRNGAPVSALIIIPFRFQLE